MYLQDLKDIPDFNLDPPEDEYELSKEEKQELYDNYLEELYERDVVNYNGPYGEADIKWY